MNKDTLEEFIASTPSEFNGTSIGQQLARLDVSVSFFCEVKSMWCRYQGLLKDRAKNNKLLLEYSAELECIADHLKGVV